MHGDFRERRNMSISSLFEAALSEIESLGAMGLSLVLYH
jgi:hypothetical protein